jgi:hypothetical protein
VWKFYCLLIIWNLEEYLYDCLVFNLKTGNNSFTNFSIVTHLWFFIVFHLWLFSVFDCFPYDIFLFINAEQISIKIHRKNVVCLIMFVFVVVYVCFIYYLQFLSGYRNGNLFASNANIMLTMLLTICTHSFYYIYSFY